MVVGCYQIALMASVVPSLQPPSHLWRRRPSLSLLRPVQSRLVWYPLPSYKSTVPSSELIKLTIGTSARVMMFRTLVARGRHSVCDGKRMPCSLPSSVSTCVSTWCHFSCSTSVDKLTRRRSLSHVCTSSEGEVMEEGKLLKAIVYEAQHGFSNVSGLASRFGEFLYAQLSLRSTTCGNDFSSLKNDARRYDELDSVNRAQLLDRVAQAMGFLDTQDLFAHHIALREASIGLQDPSECLSETSTTTKAIPTQEALGKNVAIKNAPDSSHGDKKAAAFSKSFRSAIKFGSSEPIMLYKPNVDGKGKDPTTQLKVSAKIANSFEVIESQTKGSNDKAVRQTKQKLARNSVAVASTLDDRITSIAGVAGSSDIYNKVSDFDSSSVEVNSTELMLMRGAANYKDCVLDIPLKFVKNLSVYQRTRLEENGFHTLRMLLQHFPRTYVNFQQAGQRVEDGQHLSFVGTIMSSSGLRLSPSLGAIEVIVKSKVDAQDSYDEHPDKIKSQHGKTVFLHLKKFFRGARFTTSWFLNKMATKYPVHAQVSVGGKVKALPREDHFEIREYNLELWDQNSNDSTLDGSDEVKPELEMVGKPYPVYPSKGGLQPKTVEFCIQRLLPTLPFDLDPLPNHIREKHNFVELRQAYFGIHNPRDAEDAEKARQRLVFDEFYYLQLGLLLQRQQIANKYLGDVRPSLVGEDGTLDMERWSPLTLKLVKSLPYTLTNSQKKAASEIMWDLQRPVPMSRLLQGDVGCGKTVVAFLGLVEVIDAGYQGALMAPTEFLAIQHYKRIMGWLEFLDDHERPRVALLTGSIPAAKARIIRSELESGEIALAVGTHSLISDSVRFANLGLAVVDEQHRFGVAQRGRLNSKARENGAMLNGVGTELTESRNSEADGTSAVLLGAPHVLAMSATPIPRTLALAMHGDMSISQITELPPGRPKTTTLTFQSNEKGRREVYKMMREELESGGRVFVVYPVIELSEELPELRAAETEFEAITKEFEGFQCGLVHGRMKAHEKEAAMELFKTGKSQILVSTTVIEVGIDIPEASMIVIEHAERYGMAQLHQLRGRVGRGSRDSKCVLLGSTSASLNRLMLLENSNDGFYLAEVDLKLRGPGDMLGKRQSGFLPEFSIARLDQDGEILEGARAAAEETLGTYHRLEGLPRVKQELSIRRPPGSLG